MSWTATGLYLLIPAIVYLGLPVIYGEPFAIDRSTLEFVVPNYLYFAAPYLAWAVAHRALRLRRTVAHGGYIGAAAGLISLHLFLAGASHPEDGLIIYWLWAALAIACGGAAALVYDQRGKQSAT
jgi:hypothetical protein